MISHFDLLTQRMNYLLFKNLLSKEDAERFIFLDKMFDNFSDDEQLVRFHDNLEYSKLLLKLFDKLCFIGEPFACTKKKIIIEEFGTMSPTVFLSPWDMSLQYVDSHAGVFDEIERFWREKNAPK